MCRRPPSGPGVCAPHGRRGRASRGWRRYHISVSSRLVSSHFVSSAATRRYGHTTQECCRHQFSSLRSSLSSHLGQSPGFLTRQQWATALESTAHPHCEFLPSSPRGSATALPAAAAAPRHGGEGPPPPRGRAEMLPRLSLALRLRPERMRAAHSAVARHMASWAGLAAA